MFSKLSFHRSTWIGAGMGLAAICVILAIAAELVISGTLSPDWQLPAVCISLFLGAIPGGLVAVGKKREAQHSALCAMIIYGTMWILAFASGRHICFDTTSATATICVFAGCFVGGLIRPKQKKTGYKRGRKTRAK